MLALFSIELDDVGNGFTADGAELWVLVGAHAAVFIGTEDSCGGVSATFDLTHTGSLLGIDLGGDVLLPWLDVERVGLVVFIAIFVFPVKIFEKLFDVE